MWKVLCGSRGVTALGLKFTIPTARVTGGVCKRAVVSPPFPVSIVMFCLVLWLAETGCAGGIDPPSAYLPILSSYLQVRYTDPGTGAAIRRFKAMLDGGPADRLHYHFQFIYKANNGSATDDRLFLQDAYLIYPAGFGLSLKAGQFIPPFGLERFQPDWNLDFVERTDVTNRLVINGNLGDSFTRDRGLECDWDHSGWQLSAGLFHGAGANEASRGNGPLGVARLSYGSEGVQEGRQWLWRGGLAGSVRHVADLDFSAQLPGLSKKLTSLFQGQDSRLNAFAQINWGPLSAQGEYFRVWLEPASGSEIAATGAYGQVAYQPIKGVILGLRQEWFNPDVHEPTASTTGRVTVAATYDLPWLPLRLATDYSWADRGTEPAPVWRIQVQYFPVKGFKLN
jgi:hypothetical protein